MDHIEKWMAFYDSPNIEVKKRALRHIVQVTNTRLVPILIDAYGKFALQGFGADIARDMKRMGDPRFVEPIMRFTTHPDYHMRSLSCSVLGGLGDKRSTPVLIQCLNDLE